MAPNSLAQSYLRSKQEEVSNGVLHDSRPEPSLAQARQDLSFAISRLAQKFLAGQYGTLVSTISEQTINSSLRVFEERLERVKGDITIVCEELLDRLIISTFGTKN